MSSDTKSDHFFAKYLKNDAPIISYKEIKTRKSENIKGLATRGFTPVNTAGHPLQFLSWTFGQRPTKHDFNKPVITYQFYFTPSSLSPETVRPPKLYFFRC